LNHHAMKKISRHKLLVAGDSYDHCLMQIHKFFDLTSLVIYDCIEADPKQSVAGLDAAFLPAVNSAIARNREIMQSLIDELTANGIKTQTDLLAIEQGYLSKTLHILSHFLDGFVGIDSYFYNLLDDSHWLPATRQQEIDKSPQSYWLIHVDGYSATPEEAGLLHM
jgi:hypothetical protein